MTTLALGFVGLVLAVAGPLEMAARQGLPAEAKPSADVTLSFVQPGRVAEVAIKIGDVVKAGDVLARLDDEAQRVKVAQLKAVADDDLHIKAAEAQLEQKRADLKKLEWAGQEGAATQWEIEHARLEVVIGDMSLQKARFNKDRAREDYEQARIMLDRMTLRSPIDGRIERARAGERELELPSVGESVQALTPVVRIVKTDVLWVDWPAYLKVARRLKVGDTVQVVFVEYKGDRPEEGDLTEGDRAQGKVIHIVSLTDSAAFTRMVRIEVPNPSGLPAGMRLRVLVPASEGVAASGPP